MFVFSFSKFAGFDKVFLVDNKFNLKEWDLFSYEEDTFIYLWEKVSNLEKYNKKINFDESKITLLEKNFLSNKILKFLNLFVEENCTNYKNAISLFLSWNDILYILKQKTKQEKVYYSKIFTKDWYYDFEEEKYEWQHLILVPDLRTWYNLFKDFEIYHWWSSYWKKAKLFWQIKKGNRWNLLATHSQIFKDWKNLKLITIFMPHKWYYKNHQDPRYNVLNTIELFSNIYWSDINYINDFRLK